MTKLPSLSQLNDMAYIRLNAAQRKVLRLRFEGEPKTLARFDRLDAAHPPEPGGWAPGKEPS